jgi:hypothetical protein
MSQTLNIQTIVQPGHKVEVQTPELAVGEAVQVIVLPIQKRQEAFLDVVERLPARRLFKTAEEVDAYMKEERDSWER